VALIILLIALSSSMLYPGRVNAARPAAPLVEQAASVARVEALSDDRAPAIGSGTIVAPERIVVPCHLVRNTRQIVVRGKNREYPAALQETDGKRDLCLLSVPELVDRGARRGAADKLRVRQPVSAIAIFGSEVQIRRGKITNLRLLDDAYLIQIDIPLPSEASGGGLFDAAGGLIGVLAAFLPNENLNFALPVRWIDDLPARAAGSTRFVLREGTASQAARVARANQLQAKEDWNGLVMLSQQWIKADRADRRAWLMAGIAQQHLKQNEKAAASYLESLRLLPLDPAVWNNLCVAYGELQRKEAAVRSCEIASYTDADSSVRWFNLAATYHYAGLFDKAAMAYRQTLRLDPDHTEARRQLELLEPRLESARNGKTRR